MKTPQFPVVCGSFESLREWAADWNHLNDVPTTVCRLFEEWDYRVKEATALEVTNAALLDACKAARADCAEHGEAPLLLMHLDAAIALAEGST